ncbi:hypothetical protein [Streptomyces sp. NPDC056549]|uniref:hypothetical protein n=1 Tax=Streptomyces sp. NPDC056549 TaxID=3345864 RepID=UPI0036AC6646
MLLGKGGPPGARLADRGERRVSFPYLRLEVAALPEEREGPRLAQYDLGRPSVWWET